MQKKQKKPPAFTRSDVDRRSGEDRRQGCSLDYFDTDGKERRSYMERRYPHEKRLDWVRYSKWHSVYIGGYPVDLFSDDEEILIDLE